MIYTQFELDIVRNRFFSSLLLLSLSLSHRNVLAHRKLIVSTKRSRWWTIFDISDRNVWYWSGSLRYLRHLYCCLLCREDASTYRWFHYINEGREGPEYQKNHPHSRRQKSVSASRDEILTEGLWVLTSESLSATTPPGGLMCNSSGVGGQTAREWIGHRPPSRKGNILAHSLRCLAELFTSCILLYTSVFWGVCVPWRKWAGVGSGGFGMREGRGGGCVCVWEK